MNTDVSVQLFLREHFNGVFFILSVYLVVLISASLWKSWKRASSFYEWRSNANVAGLIGVNVYFIGEAMRAAWAWMLIKALNDSGGNNTSAAYRWVSSQWELLLMGIFLACVGMLCAIRWWSPSKWGWCNTVAAAVITAATLLAASFFDFN